MTDEERSMIEWRAGLMNIGLERRMAEDRLVMAKEKARIAAKFEREWDRIYWQAIVAIWLIAGWVVADIIW